jgi:Tol biopolymer transport system component
MRTRISATAALLVAALIAVILPPLSRATYPGKNGEIAIFRLGGQSLAAVNPDDPGVARPIASCPRGTTNCSISEPTWSPSGRRLAFVQGQGIVSLRKPTHLFLYVVTKGGRPGRLAACGSCNGLAWSPRGKWIAYSRDDFHTFRTTLWIVPAAGGKPRRLTHCQSCADVNPSWSPNGHLLVYEHITSGSTTLYTIHANGSDPTKIANGQDPQWSPNGRSIVFDNAQGIEVANADGSGVQLLFAQTGGAGPGVPSWSPDGKKLVFFNTPGSPGKYRAEVWTMNADGTDQQRLYHSGCCVEAWSAPIWSPDGTKIAFAADSAGGVYVMNADGSGLKELLPSYWGWGDSLMSWQPRP